MNDRIYQFTLGARRHGLCTKAGRHANLRRLSSCVSLHHVSFWCMITLIKHLPQFQMHYKDEWKLRSKIYSNSNLFMLLWSLGSGYGIMFALLSWMWNIFGIIDDPIFSGSKGVIAICFGFIIGYIHYKLSIVEVKKQSSPKYADAISPRNKH